MNAIAPTAAATKHQPLPGAPFSPDMQVATFTYAEGPYQSFEDIGYRDGVWASYPDTSPLGLKETKSGGWSRSVELPTFVEAGTDFKKAIEEAASFTRGRDADGAHAVLQAQDGTFYITALTHRVGPRAVDSIDGHSHDFHFTGVKVTPETDALKAVVGNDTFLNFTDEEINPKFS